MNDIKNLNQMKKAINAGRSFRVIKHYIHEDYTGQIRKPNVIQTHGFYSICENDPESRATKANGGKGVYLEYGKAGDYEFTDKSILIKHRNGKPCLEIEFICKGE